MNNKTKDVVRCAIYCRVSTEYQDTSIVNQQEYFKDYVERNKDKGYIISEIYTDEAISGGGISKREDFKRMVKDGENGKYDCLLAKSYSRFGRNLRDSLDVISKLKEHNVRIIFIEDGLDSERDYNNFALFGWLAESEIRRTSDRIKMTWEHYNNRGIIHACHPPYGYNYDKTLKNFVVNEDERPVVKYIFDMYVNKGYGFTKIANILDSEGVPTKKGGKWANPTVKNIVTNRAYIGDLVMGKKEKIDVVINKNKKIPESKWIIHENRFEAIIDKELFWKAQAQNKQRISEFDYFKRKSTASLFSNLIKCPYCGCSFVRKRQKHFRNYTPYYSCVKYELEGKTKCGHSRIAIWEEDLVEIIREQLSMIAKDKCKLLNEIIEAQDRNKPKEKDYSKELKKIERKIKDVTDLSIQSLKLLTTGIIKENQYRLQSEQFDKELEELMKEKEFCLLKIKDAKHKTDDRKELIASVENLVNSDSWDNGMLKNAIEYIEIFKDKTINIQFKFSHF